MQFSVKVPKMQALEKKLDGKFLLQPAVQTRLRDKLIERVTRRRKTAGFRINPLAIESFELSSTGSALTGSGELLAKMGTPLNPAGWKDHEAGPRVSGRSWLGFVISLVRGSFMRRQVGAAIKDIEAAWKE